jgi:hypothetical protein
MAIWGKTSGEESRPKSLPMDSNSGYSREFVTATSKGWVMQPGTASAATGNDNVNADPEILVAIRNLSVNFLSGNLLSVDWTNAELADTGLFDLVLTFDEEVSITSADITATPNQTVTNKAYILLSRLGGTDMVEDSTVMMAYLTAAGAAAADGDRGGSGTNTLTFRGKLQSAAAGYLAFTDNFIHLNGTATLQSDSETFSGVLAESGTSSVDSIVLDASSGANGQVNGAVSDSTTITVNNVGGTIAVGQVVTVNGEGSAPAASITSTNPGSNGTTDTSGSTDNTITITAVASQTEFTVSENVTIADDIELLFSADGGEGIEMNTVSMALEGADGATSVVSSTAYRTGFGIDTFVGRVNMLEAGGGYGSGKVINETDGTSGFAAESFTTDAAGLVTETQAGSASGSSEILKGITTL